ncbi:hypothetical protein CASFOL_030984 [Castilleja foliolosa]|uniref:Uncharacterized protein n=1 Tax=Castilleja foliolosa TaxID=1961234 RepID=A0ABD3C6U9_9LAMI
MDDDAAGVCVQLSGQINDIGRIYFALHSELHQLGIGCGGHTSC